MNHVRKNRLLPYLGIPVILLLIFCGLVCIF